MYGLNPNRAEVDDALLAGTPLRQIARHVSLSKDAVARHRTHVDSLLQLPVLVEAAREEAIRVGSHLNPVFFC